MLTDVYVFVLQTDFTTTDLLRLSVYAVVNLTLQAVMLYMKNQTFSLPLKTALCYCFSMLRYLCFQSLNF